MKIEIFADDLTKEDCDLSNHRVGCRGIVKRDNKYLLVHVLKMDIFTFPGGGLELNESLEECVIREVLEETGISVSVNEMKISITEYFKDSVWTNHYFTCEYLNWDNNANLTDEELLLGLDVEWMTMEEVMDTFENHETNHIHGPNVHNREFLGFLNSI